jgi:transketolase C-terminal domain/subunit
MKMIGINDVFALNGQYEEVMDYYGLDPASIAKSIEDFVNI